MSELNGVARRTFTVSKPQGNMTYNAETPDVQAETVMADANADTQHKDHDHAELDKLLSKMELPINRRSARRPQDVRWLIDNLGKRNSAQPGFARAWQLLLSIAERESVLKASELRRLREAA